MAEVPDGKFWREVWGRVALRGFCIVGGVFATYELLEWTVLAGASGATLHALHIVRGVGTAFLLATWAFVTVRRARREFDARIADNLAQLELRVRERTKEAEEARAFTELLFDSMRERILVVDSRGLIVKSNRVADVVAGQPLAGKACAEVFGARARGGDCMACRGLDPRRRGAARVDTRASAGRVWEFETIALPDADGNRRYVIEVGRDVTERQALEAQLRHQEKMASLGVLTAGFAHDIGNPLASLSTELELLESEDDLSRVRDSIGVVRRHVQRMTRTLREMVDFARRRRDEVSDVSVAAAVADSVRLVEHDPRWKSVRLSVDTPSDLPALHMVEDHLVLVLVNLMLNAADAMPDGGELGVVARRLGAGAEITVSDTGTGMTPDVLARAATPLFTTKPPGRGTGLGLSVCDGIVRAAGGTLRIESSPGAGTRVTIFLPADGGAELGAWPPRCAGDPAACGTP